MFKRKLNKKLGIDTLVGPKTRIDGDVEFCGGFHVDGHINGNVHCTSGTDGVLSVSEHGCIEGSVRVANVMLNGTVNGDIDAVGRVELGPKARVLGNVHYGVIESAVGAQINGKLMHRAQPPAAVLTAGFEAEPSL